MGVSVSLSESIVLDDGDGGRRGVDLVGRSMLIGVDGKSARGENTRWQISRKRWIQLKRSERQVEKYFLLYL